MPAMDFAGQAVVVTGGTRGIGAGIARGFLAAGADVLVCARHPPVGGAAGSGTGTSGRGTGTSSDAPGTSGGGTGTSALEDSGLLAADGRTAAFIQADVRDPEQAQRLMQGAADRFGRVDVVISSAGGSPPAAAATASPRFHARVIELNLIAPLHVVQAANAVLQDQPGGGSIIMVGSISGTRPSPGTAAYGAAKAGLHHLATSLAVEWAPKVRVNCVVPGLVATESAGDHYGGEAGVAAVAGTVPLGRMGSPGDVADACLFLASPLAAYLSGAALVLHGGGERPAFLAAAESVYAPND